MTRRLLLAACLSVTLPVLTRAAEKVDAVQETVAKTHTPATGAPLLYREYRPKSDKPLPLIILLHGSGERGNDNAAQLKHGASDLIRLGRERNQPAVLLVPQCPTGKKWCEVDWSAPTHDTPEHASDSAGAVLEVVDALVKDGMVDPKRIYLTGLSMGGYGTWDLLVRRPTFFAAALPICGGGDEKRAKDIAAVPVWVVHGDKDGAVPVARSRNMVAALKAAGGTPIYTEVAGGGHDVWTQTYRDEKVYDWLFKQSR